MAKIYLRLSCYLWKFPKNKCRMKHVFFVNIYLLITIFKKKKNIMRSLYLIIVILITLSSCSNIAFGDKMFIRKIDKSYSFSSLKDSSLSVFKNKYGNDFVYKELDSSIKRLYVSHITFNKIDIFFPKPPLYFEFKNDIMSEFGVIRPGFTSLNFVSFKNGVKVVKKEKIFPIIKKNKL